MSNKNIFKKSLELQLKAKDIGLAFNCNSKDFLNILLLLIIINTISFD